MSFDFSKFVKLTKQQGGSRLFTKKVSIFPQNIHGKFFKTVKNGPQENWKHLLHKSKILRWIQIRWDLRVNTKASVSSFGASNLGPPQFSGTHHYQWHCTECLVNTENDYAYWKQVTFLLLDWSVVQSHKNEKWFFLDFLLSNYKRFSTVHRNTFRSNFGISTRRNILVRAITEVSETSCCDTTACNVPVSSIQSAVYPPYILLRRQRRSSHIQPHRDAGRQE